MMLEHFESSITEQWRGAGQLRASVLECASPLALFHHKTRRVKRRRAAALQDLADFAGQPSVTRAVLYGMFQKKI